MTRPRALGYRYATIWITSPALDSSRLRYLDPLAEMRASRGQDDSDEDRRLLHNAAVPGHDTPIEYWSTPMRKGRLVELLDDLGFRPCGKNPKLSDLVRWVVHDLPEDVRNDARAQEARAIAEFWWRHERSSKGPAFLAPPACVPTQESQAER